MKTTVNRLPKNTVEFIIELPAEEVLPFLDRAAERLSRSHPIPGFRPGKATAKIMENIVGADVLYHEAAEALIRDTFPKVVDQEKLTTVGSPDIELLKVAPGNPFVYKATVSLLPEVKLGDYRTLKVKKKKPIISDAELTKLLTQLRESRSSETLVQRPAKEGDKVEIDFKGTIDGVAVEGASSSMHPMVIGSKQFIPGFEEQLIGMQQKDKKQFTVRFPKDYHEKRLADRNVTFDVTMHSVYERSLPAADDAFAKSLGNFADLAALKKQLQANLLAEKEQKERERYELALLEAIAEISTFGEFPDRLITSECEKMLHELRHSITESGMEFARYLESIKKSEEDLKKEFQPKAERRIRTALVTRAIADKEHISVNDKVVQQEIAETKQMYQGNADIEANLSSPEYARYLKNALTTKQVTEFLDDLIGAEAEEEKTK